MEEYWAEILRNKAKHKSNGQRIDAEYRKEHGIAIPSKQKRKPSPKQSAHTPEARVLWHDPLLTRKCLDHLIRTYKNHRDASKRRYAAAAESMLAKRGVSLEPKKQRKPKPKWRLKGGRVIYHLYIESDEWQAKRVQAFRRYGKTCQRCKSLPATQVHHKHYRTLGNEAMKDLEVLCQGCHQNEHEPKYGNSANIDKRFAELVKSF